jgi:hypothetical protein
MPLANVALNIKTDGADYTPVTGGSALFFITTGMKEGVGESEATSGSTFFSLPFHRLKYFALR